MTRLTCATNTCPGCPSGGDDGGGGRVDGSGGDGGGCGWLLWVVDCVYW